MNLKRTLCLALGLLIAIQQTMAMQELVAEQAAEEVTLSTPVWACAVISTFLTGSWLVWRTQHEKLPQKYATVDYDLKTNTYTVRLADSPAPREWPDDTRTSRVKTYFAYLKHDSHNTDAFQTQCCRDCVIDVDVWKKLGKTAPGCVRVLELNTQEYTNMVARLGDWWLSKTNKNAWAIQDAWALELARLAHAKRTGQAIAQAATA